MRPMDHAEAHELLADLALEPSNVGTAVDARGQRPAASAPRDLRRLPGRPPCLAEHAPGDRGRPRDRPMAAATDGRCSSPSGRSRRRPHFARRSRRSPGRRAASRRTPLRHPPRIRAQGRDPTSLQLAAAAPILAAVAVLVIGSRSAPRSGGESRRCPCRDARACRRSPPSSDGCCSEPDHQRRRARLRPTARSRARSPGRTTTWPS